MRIKDGFVLRKLKDEHIVVGEGLARADATRLAAEMVDKCVALP